ncbi:MAG: OsmC family protein, partial [Candidatus Bathyarchaeia archaeon]
MTGNQVSAEIHHSEGLKFNVELDGRRIQLDSSEEMGQAFTPMELFLVALAGCTAMDVQWIMDKQRQKLNRFDIAING